MHTRCETVMGTCLTPGCDTVGIYQWNMYDNLPPIFCLSVTATKQNKTSGVSPSTGNAVNLPIGKPIGPREDQRAMVRVPRVSCHSSTILNTLSACSFFLSTHTHAHTQLPVRMCSDSQSTCGLFFSTRTHAHTHKLYQYECALALRARSSFLFPHI